MKINQLYVIGGENYNLSNKLVDKNSKVVFLDKAQDSFKNQFLLLKNFLERQNSLRQKWLMFQEEVFKRIRNKIDNDEDFHYVLSNIFFEASPNKTNSIFLFFKLYLIIDYIKKENINNIFLINVEKKIKTFFEINQTNLSITVNIISLQKNNFFSTKSFKQIEKKNLFFSLFSTLVKEYKNKRQNIVAKKSQSHKVVLSYNYPGCHSFHKGFRNKFYEDVSSLLNKDYHWLFQYVGQVSKLGKENKLLTAHFNAFSFLDAYFSTSDFINVIPQYLRIRKKLKSIKLEKLFVYEEINYFCLFKSEWLISNTILLFKLLIYEKKISNFLLKNPQINEILYMMEFQPWEQILNKIAKKYKIKTKGFVHSIVRPNVMNYYHSKLLHSYLHLPKVVGANSEFSKLLLLKNGFTQEQVYEVEAHRFNYLNYDQSKTSSLKRQIKKTILIVTSIIAKETIELLQKFANSNVKFEKIYIKEHHLFPVGSIIRSSIKNFPSYEIFHGTVSEAFGFSDIVYVANGSSVLLESVIKQKPTVTLISLSSIPIPAIEKAKNLYFAYNEVNLSNILNKLIVSLNNESASSDYENYLYLDNKLTLWRNFLEI